MYSVVGSERYYMRVNSEEIKFVTVALMLVGILIYFAYSAISRHFDARDQCIKSGGVMVSTHSGYVCIDSKTVIKDSTK